MNVRYPVEARLSLCRCVSETDDTAFGKVLTDLFILLIYSVLLNCNVWTTRKFNPRGIMHESLELCVYVCIVKSAHACVRICVIFRNL